jgi:signal transduction histidine kinase
MYQWKDEIHSQNSDVTTESWQEMEKRRLSDVLEYDMRNHDIDDPGLLAITKLATYICGTPMGFVTLVGQNYVDVLSRVGCDYTGVMRLNSFCTYAIQEDGFFEVEDVSKDSRFNENYYVKTQKTPPQYYGAWPIKSVDGNNLGTLCVVDTKPGKLNDDQIEALKTLREQVTVHLQLRKQNKELMAAKLKAEKLSRAMDEFISNMSHELRTPLNAINGYAHILNKTILTKEQEEAVEIIKNSSDILITLVNDILDFSKINCEKLKLEKIPFKLEKTVKLVYDLLLNKADQKNIILELVYDKNIPKQIMGDKIRINQILINLAGNAIKFTDKGSVKIQVKMKEETKDDISIDFLVKDTGIGINKNNLETIFERFEQAESETCRKYGGSGLGLNISKNLVELHGGKLKVRSVVGEGSEFYFTIKYAKVSESDKIKNFKLRSKLNLSNITDLKLLVCEDNLINIKLIKKKFENKVLS